VDWIALVDDGLMVRRGDDIRSQSSPADIAQAIGDWILAGKIHICYMGTSLQGSIIHSIVSPYLAPHLRRRCPRGIAGNLIVTLDSRRG
jgi:hypothetical protein